MIDRLRLVIGSGFDPSRNLAVEEYLLKASTSGLRTLYLWQNAHAVVIGRNQNAWRECRVDRLREDGGHLVRRLSGGGAVYHDLGNLNFSLITPSEDFDVARQLGIAIAACRKLGIDAHASGRNDLALADGRKFSGSAFYHHAGQSLHHGTLLVCADKERASAYLSPSKAKLEAKGVSSVQARIANLADVRPDVTIGDLRRAMIESFEEAYGLTAACVYEGGGREGKAREASVLEDKTRAISACGSTMHGGGSATGEPDRVIIPGPEGAHSSRLYGKPDDALDESAISELQKRYRSPEWNLGHHLPFSYSVEHRFDWGEVVVELQVEQGVITRATVFTDAMDASLAILLEEALSGTRFDAQELAAKVAECRCQGAEDLAGLLGELEI